MAKHRHLDPTMLNRRRNVLRHSPEQVGAKDILGAVSGTSGQDAGDDSGEYDLVGKEHR